MAVVRESKAAGDNTYDVPGAVLATGGLVAIVYGFTEAAKPDAGWSAGSTLGLLVGGVVLLAAFVVVELRTTHPMLPLRIVVNRNRGGAFLSALLVSAGLFAMFLFLAFYFQQNLGYSPVKSGLAFLPFSGGVAVAAGIASAVLPRIGAKPVMLVGALMGSVGLAYLTRLGPDSSYLTHVLPAELLMSLGMGLVFVAQTTLALHGVGEHDAGVASAMLNTSQQIGGALGTALLNTLYASAVTSYLATHPATSAAVLGEATISGYHRAFLVGAVFLAAALVVTAVLVNAKKSELSKPEGAAIGH